MHLFTCNYVFYIFIDKRKKWVSPNKNINGDKSEIVNRSEAGSQTLRYLKQDSASCSFSV